jgi:hypothetical protein
MAAPQVVNMRLGEIAESFLGSALALVIPLVSDIPKSDIAPISNEKPAHGMNATLYCPAPNTKLDRIPPEKLPELQRTPKLDTSLPPPTSVLSANNASTAGHSIPVAAPSNSLPTTR